MYLLRVIGFSVGKPNSSVAPSDGAAVVASDGAADGAALLRGDCSAADGAADGATAGAAAV